MTALVLYQAPSISWFTGQAAWLVGLVGAVYLAWFAVTLIDWRHAVWSDRRQQAILVACLIGLALYLIGSPVVHADATDGVIGCGPMGCGCGWWNLFCAI